jgi:hypothetical protein
MEGTKALLASEVATIRNEVHRRWKRAHGNKNHGEWNSRENSVTRH